MVVDYNRLCHWEKARNGSDEVESVRILAKILSSTNGRTFILDLEPPGAELCLEILDYVSSNSPPIISDGRSPIQWLTGQIDGQIPTPEAFVAALTI